MKLALFNVAMQSRRLRTDVDNSVVFAGDDDYRHLQFWVSITEMKRHPESSAQILTLTPLSGTDAAPSLSESFQILRALTEGQISWSS